MQVLNFGSLNIDRVLRVEHIVRPGETIASTSVELLAGGKGANQSVALARAGIRVSHAGKIGDDGRWLREKLAAEGIDVRHIQLASGPTGQATIQVDDVGQNAIVLLCGANHEITPADIDRTLNEFGSDTLLLIQNEISNVAYLMTRAAERGLRICFNPAPFDAGVMSYPLHLASMLVVNESEGAAMAGVEHSNEILDNLARKLPECEVVLTLGERGAIYQGREGRIAAPAAKVNVVDTTAAGDTFIGYFLSAHLQQLSAAEALELACQAAAACVTRKGALDSIPRIEDLRR